MNRRLALTILLILTAARVLAQCPDGVCFVPSPHGSVAGAGSWPSPLVPVADASLTRRVAASTVRIVHEFGGAQSIGSGTIVDKNGPAALVLTCGHLFREGIGRVVVVAPDNRTYAARVLDVDSAWDIAVLMIGAPDAPAIPIAPSPPAGRETLAYAGFGPQGRFASGSGRLVGYVRMQGTPTADTLQFTGSARQGDSGGPIVNARGQLVGLIVGTNGRIVIGPSCRPIKRILERFVGPRAPGGRRAPTEGWSRVPGRPAGRDVEADPAPPAGRDAAQPQRASQHRQEEAAGARDDLQEPTPRPSRRHTMEPADDAPASLPAGTAGPTDLLPLLLAAVGISVPPTSVFVALRVLRCIRHRRRNRKGQNTNDNEESDTCAAPADRLRPPRRCRPYAVSKPSSHPFQWRGPTIRSPTALRPPSVRRPVERRFPQPATGQARHSASPATTACLSPRPARRRTRIRPT
jgi:hypothetical protein